MAFGYKPLAATFAELNRQMEVNQQNKMRHQERMTQLKMKQDERNYERAMWERYQRPQLELQAAKIQEETKMVNPNIFEMSGSGQGNDLIFRPREDGRAPSDYALDIFTNGDPNVAWNPATGGLMNKESGEAIQMPNWLYKQRAVAAGGAMLSRIAPEELVQSQIDKFQSGIEQAEVQMKEINPKDPTAPQKRLNLTNQINSLTIRRNNEMNKLATPQGIIQLNQDYADKAFKMKAMMQGQGASAGQLALYDQAVAGADKRVATQLKLIELDAAQKRLGTKDVVKQVIHRKGTKKRPADEQVVWLRKGEKYDPPKGYKLGALPEEKKPRDLRSTEQNMSENITARYGELDEKGQFFVTEQLSGKANVAKAIAAKLIRGDKAIDPGIAQNQGPNWVEKQEADYWLRLDKLQERIDPDTGKSITKAQRKTKIATLKKNFRKLMRQATLIDGTAIDYLPNMTTRKKALEE